MTDTNAPLPGRNGGTSRPRDRAGNLRRVLDPLTPGREARQRYETLVQELADAVWEMDPALTEVRFVSDRLADLVGRSPREMAADRAMWLRDVVHPDDRQAFLDFMTKLRTEGTAEIEYRGRHADGHEVWLRTRAHRVYDDSGKPRSVNGVTADITALRAAQSELVASEQQYRLLVEGLPVIPYRDALDGSKALYVGPRIEPLLGYTQAQWLAGGMEWWFRLVHPEDLLRVARATEESIERQSPLSIRYRVRHAESGWRWFDDEAIVVQGDDGRPLYRQGVLRDVTAEELATRAQGEAEQRFRIMVEQLPMAVYIDQPDDTFTKVYISPQIERMLGYPVEQWMDNPEMFQSVLHPDDREAVLAGQREWLERGGEYQGEYRLVTRDGDAVWIREESIVVAGDDGDALYTQGYLEDVTERRAAQRDLETSERRLRMVTDNMNDVIFLYGMDRKLRYVTPSFEDLTGFTVEELFARNFLNDVHPDDEARMLPLWRAVFDGESYTGAEFRIINSDGREKWCWSAGSPVRDASGAQIGVQIRDADITARKKAELRLRASEERSRLIIDTTEDAFLALDAEALAMEWNRAAAEMFGFERDEVIGRDIISLVLAEESYQAMAELLDRAAAAGPDADHPPAELVGRRRTGEEFPVEVALWPLQTGEDLTFNAFIRDITERKLREERVTFLAYHDQLTGLPNRTMFEHHLDLVLARAAHDGTAAALLYLDVDKFKHVNDTFGHDAGDELLKEVAKRLRAAARASDLVVRLGGDEFLIVLGDVPVESAATVAEGVARRVCQAFERPFDVGGGFTTSSSIGIGLFPADAHDAKSLLSAADLGMYASKRAERGGWTFASGDTQAA
jgi:diguanylate cyclase (GGDEF)-like protein/PAS domain S-box-containing protein